MPVGDPLADRLEQAEVDGELAHRGRLAAGDDQGVDGVQLLGPADRTGERAALGERAQVLADVALQREHADTQLTRLRVPPKVTATSRGWPAARLRERRRR